MGAPKETIGLVGYVVYKEGKVVEEVKNTTSVGRGLKSNTIYGFKVSAKYSNGKESKPVSVNITTKK